MSDAASIIPRAVSLPRVSAASSRRVSAGSSDFARGRHRPLSRRVLPPRSVAVRRDAMASLGTMKPEIVADGVLHVRTPLIISKPMRCASPHHRPTPPLPSTTDRSDPLTASPTPDIRSERLGKDVYIKLDALQPSGSFKLRGIGYTCQKAVAEGARCLISSSGGNAGLATAYAGQRWGAPTTVVVPETTPEFIRDRLRSYGATVEVHGSQWSEANERAVALCAAADGKLVHPFEDVDTWTGHATVVHEMRDDLAALGLGDVIPGAVVTCVGGGGLLAGILQGLDEVGWGRDVPVVAAETVGADSLATSLDEGRVATLPGIASVAKSLGAASPSSAVFDMCVARRADRLVRSWRVEDARAVEACMRFADEHRLLVEPACGAALAAVYSGECEHLEDVEGPVIVEVCGGAIVDRKTMEGYARQFGLDF